jgi:hypothetical protein
MLSYSISTRVTSSRAVIFNERERIYYSWVLYLLVFSCCETSRGQGATTKAALLNRKWLRGVRSTTPCLEWVASSRNQGLRFVVLLFLSVFCNLASPDDSRFTIGLHAGTRIMYMRPGGRHSCLSRILLYVTGETRDVYGNGRAISFNSTAVSYEPSREQFKRL